MIPSTVLLSVCIGVGSCGWSSSSNDVFNGGNSSAFMHSYPTSTSAASPITKLIIFASKY